MKSILLSLSCVSRKTYLLLELEGDTSDGSLDDSLHQMGCVASDLVPQSLGLDSSNIVKDALVGVEVLGQPCVGVNLKLTFRSTSQSQLWQLSSQFWS